MNSLEYRKNYYSGTRLELLNNVQTALSDYRYQHVLRVETMALKLAETWQVDPEIVSVAALVHDYTKERPDDDFIEAIQKYHLSTSLISWGNNIWHGVVGAEIIQSELGISEPIILDAVRQHTTGAEEMTLVSQIIFMADYIESARSFPGIDEVRALAFTDLAASVGWQAQHTLEYLIKNKQRVFPLSLLTYNTWSTK